MTTPDIPIDLVPGAPGVDLPRPAEPEPPASPAERPAGNRGRKALLGILAVALIGLIGLSVWYLTFRKPITEIPLPVAPAALPTYQGTFYDLTSPQGIAVSTDASRLYVTQTGGSRETVMLDAKGQRLGSLKPPTSVAADPRQLYVAVSPVTNEVWATDRANSAVVIYNQDGSFSRRFDEGTALKGWQPLGIGFDHTGNVFIADAGAPQRVHQFSPDGKLIRDIGANESLDHPNGIAVANDGTVYVSDTGNGRLLVFDASGARVGIVARGNAAGNLGLPVGVAIDDHGRVVVADSSGANVQLYAPLKAGERGPGYVGSVGAKGSVDGAFSYPNGLTTDSRGRIYVADWGNDRLQVWSY